MTTDQIRDRIDYAEYELLNACENLHVVWNDCLPELTAKRKAMTSEEFRYWEKILTRLTYLNRLRREIVKKLGKK